MTLRGSANYIWFETDNLGQGATASVYKARHKRNGDLFAVKTFNHMSHMRPMDVQMREFQVLQKINHENIVKLLAIEEDSINKMKVIVMELCTGGSLYTLLEEPANSFGFEEKEFLSVMSDVASGLRYLREIGIVHRDIKPGNILLYTSEDGRHIYKLTDFGAARELQEEEQFMSLYGTEEYLFPDMYARAVLKRPVDRPFDASVDLWSLGVTLYHVATGDLPFRPYGGRNNKHTMYQMTSNKEPGVISSIQHEAGGPIESSRQLPNTCLLTKGAKLLVTPILAGLMESRDERMWTFDQFFDQVYLIMKKKLIHVFNANECTPLHVYLDPANRLTQFQEAIAKQTDLPVNQQVLMFDRGYFTEHVTPMLEVKKYPKTSDTNPLLLFLKCDRSDSIEFPPFKLPDIPKPTNGSSIQPVNFYRDYTQAKSVTKILYYLKRNATYNHERQNLISLAAKVFLFTLCINITQIRTFAQQFAVLVEETEKRIKWFRVQHHKNVDLLSKTYEMDSAASREIAEYSREGDNFIQDNIDKLKEISSGSKQAMVGVEDFYHRIVEENELASEHISEYSCKDTQKCIRKFEVLLNEMSKTVMSFRADKRKQDISHNEEQIHKSEKYKMKSSCDKGKYILLNCCCGCTKHVFSKFTEWFRWACEVRNKLDVYENHLSTLTTLQADVSQKMDVCQSQHFEKMERILQGHQVVNNSHVELEQDFVVFNREDIPVVSDVPEASGDDTKKDKPSIKALHSSLVNLKSDTDDIKHWLHQNTGLLQELRQLVDEP